MELEFGKQRIYISFENQTFLETIIPSPDLFLTSAGSCSDIEAQSSICALSLCFLCIYLVERNDKNCSKNKILL